MPETRTAAREPQVTLPDLTAELLWTRTLRTPALALRPGRVLLGMAAVFIATLIGDLSLLWSDRPRFGEQIAAPIGDALAQAASAVASLSAAELLGAVAALALLPGDLLRDRPLDTLVLGLPMVLVFALFGGAIARSTASEFAAARITEWPADLRVSAGKLAWSFAGLVAPLALACLLLGVVMLGGFTLGVPGLNILGAILYAVALVFGLVALVLFVMQSLALPMIVPALVVEGTDAFDAVQRAYAYIIARPLRLLLHAGLLLLLGAVSLTLVNAVAGGSVALTDWAATRMTSDAGVRVLEGGGDLTATQPAAHAIVAGWKKLVAVIVAGFAVSFYFSGGAVLYLVARRICDGQGTGEIWDPAADAE